MTVAEQVRLLRGRMEIAVHWSAYWTKVCTESKDAAESLLASVKATKHNDAALLVARRIARLQTVV